MRAWRVFARHARILWPFFVNIQHISLRSINAILCIKKPEKRQKNFLNLLDFNKTF